MTFEEERKKRSEYRKKNRLKYKDRYAEQRKEWRRNNPSAYKAHNKVQNAQRHGRLTKPEYCERCNRNEPLQATHDDYTKPFEVEWLCQKCHSEKDGVVIGERRYG